MITQPFPMIYKKTSTGATQIWYQEVEGSKYRTVTGQIDGKKTTSAWTQAEATNVGRANERDPEAQAMFEVTAARKKKLDKEYHENIDDIEEAKNFLPMLAEKYKDYYKIVDYKTDTFVQPKLDGMRCIAQKSGLTSRNGKPILSCPHVMEALQPLFDAYPELILDGELYNHDYYDDFNTIISSAKKLKPDEAELAVSAALIEYHVYDLPSSASVNFRERTTNLATLIAKLHPEQTVIRYVETQQVQNEFDLTRTYERFLEAGYEGQIIRLEGPYLNKRTKTLLKRTETITEEFELVDIEEGIGNWAGYAKRAILKMKDGTQFGAGIGGTQAFTKELLENKVNYIGSKTTVQYRMLTPDGVPRFGVAKEFNRTDNT